MDARLGRGVFRAFDFVRCVELPENSKKRYRTRFDEHFEDVRRQSRFVAAWWVARVVVLCRFGEVVDCNAVYGVEGLGSSHAANAGLSALMRLGHKRVDGAPSDFLTLCPMQATIRSDT